MRKKIQSYLKIHQYISICIFYEKVDKVCFDIVTEKTVREEESRIRFLFIKIDF